MFDLGVLESFHRAHQDEFMNSIWITWKGGFENPIPGKRKELLFRNGQKVCVNEVSFNEGLFWVHHNSGDDIVGYRQVD